MSNQETAQVSGDSGYTWKGAWKRWVAVLGPTSLVASVAMGPGTTGDMIASGASFGYKIGWFIVLTAFWAVLGTYLVGRVTCVTGLSAIELAEKYFGRWAGWAVFILMTLIILPIEAFTGQVVGETFHFMFPFLSSNVWLVVWLVIILYLYVYKGSKEFISTVSTYLVAIMTLAFLINFIWVGPDWKQLGSGLVVPWVPSGSEGMMMFVGVLGGSVGIINLMVYGYTVKSTGWRVKDIPVMAVDNTVFMGILFALFSLGIYWSGASVLPGKAVGSPLDAAAALEPIAGAFSKWLFSIGYFAASLTSGAGACFIVAWMLRDLVKWEVKGDVMRDRRFKILSGLVLGMWLFGPVVGSFLPPITLMIFGMQLFAVGTPPIVLLYLLVCRRRDIMGDFITDWFTVIAVTIMFLASSYLAYQAIVTNIIPMLTGGGA